MEYRTKFLIPVLVFSLLIEVQSFSFAPLKRIRRDSNPMDKVIEAGTALGMQGMGIAMEAAEKGVSVQRSQSVGTEIFGQKFGVGYDSKAGVGAGGNDRRKKRNTPNSDLHESGKRDRRRAVKYNRSASDSSSSSSSESHERRKRREIFNGKIIDGERRRRAVSDRDNVVPSDYPQKEQEVILKRLREVWGDVMKRITSWLDEASKTMA